MSVNKAKPVNLLGMGGILISVWALVVVVSLFSGFLQVVEEHVKSASSDIVVSDLPDWIEWPELQAALEDDPNVAATAPRCLHYGMLNPPGKRPPPAPLPGKSALHGGDLSIAGTVALRCVEDWALTDVTSVGPGRIVHVSRAPVVDVTDLLDQGVPVGSFSWTAHAGLGPHVVVANLVATAIGAHRSVARRRPGASPVVRGAEEPDRADLGGGAGEDLVAKPGQEAKDDRVG